MSLERRTVSSTLSPILTLRALMAWALAASRQSNTHSLAEVWMTPPPLLLGERDRNWGGNPAEEKILNYKRLCLSISHIGLDQILI